VSANTQISKATTHTKLSEMLLQINDLKKAYLQPDGEVLPILDIPSYKVDKGEPVVLIGRSGGGKTTFLHSVAGITTVDSGQILFDSNPIQKLPEEARDRFRADNIGYVYQTFNLLSPFTALENVLLGMTFSKGKTDKEYAKWLLDRVGLSHRLTHKPDALSVGEQQRVAVARALANKPKLLLADEPTANIDPANQQSIIDLIRETCNENDVALIMVTHSMEVADQFDRVDKLDDINELAQAVTGGTHA